jgi:two-component system, NtrC family, response regulator AtoC
MGKELPIAGRNPGRNHDTDSAAERLGFAFVEGVSPSMRAVEAVIRELAHSEVPVLLLGERGAGKHAIARRIHEMSERSGEPFRSLHCAGLKAEELNLGAGNENGDAAPGQETSGHETSGHGTVFLEELSDLSAECQEKLLAALPKAGDKNPPRARGARLICGSARDLEVEVKTGRMREDLHYRMSGVCLRLPPLRLRKEDIPLMMDHFLRKYAHDFQRPVPSLSAETQHLFEDYSWPGNLRELEDAAKALAALGDESVAMGGLRALLRRSETNGNGGKISLKDAARAASREAEKELILKALTRTRWNRRRAAQELQISYKALLYKLKQIGCEGYGAS